MAIALVASLPDEGEGGCPLLGGKGKTSFIILSNMPGIDFSDII